MKNYSREEIISRFADTRAKGEPILICAAGLGMVARYVEMGGADMACFYSGAYLRLQGYPTVMADCHIIDVDRKNLEMSARMANVSREIPFMAGIYCVDMAQEFDRYFEELKRAGYSAVVNFPTNGIQDGMWRDGTDGAGLGLEYELSILRLAREHGLYAAGVAFDPNDAVTVARGGVDMLIYHLGLTRASEELPLELAAELVKRVIEAVHQEAPTLPVVVTGGPVIRPEDTAYIYEHTGAVGFFAGSAIDTRVITGSIADTVRAFEGKTLRGQGGGRA